MFEKFREGVVVRPYERLSLEQIRAIDQASMDILDAPGVFCYNQEAADIFKQYGARVKQIDSQYWNISLPARLIREAVAAAPSVVKLGARKPENTLLLDASVPRVYFGSGSESNIWLDTQMATFVHSENSHVKKEIPLFKPCRGTVSHLCKAAQLGEHLEHLDFFIRPLNIQDEDITPQNHDVNKFFASLNNITKHVQAGLTKLNQLDNVVLMGEIIAGGKQALRENPILSFITCVFKSPLQMVGDTTNKLIEIAKRGLPLVISSSPQGGSSAPIQEAGMVAQINAELLCGITLAQLVHKGTPVLYGSVPVRSRMDDLHDMYGAPEFNQYNIDCVQMARFYNIPCYSTAGVGDAKVPGVQATIEKLFTHLAIAMSGAHYIHYAFGLLEQTNTFCPVQAVLDNEQIGLIKHFLRHPRMSGADMEEALRQIRRVMSSPHKLFARFVRKSLHKGEISPPYAFESKDTEDLVISKALVRMDALLKKPVEHLPPEVIDTIFSKIPGILPRLKTH